MFAAAGLLFAVLALAAPPQAVRPRVHLDVTVERDVVLGAEDLRAALALVASIWAPVIDVSVSLPAAPTPAGTGDTLHVLVRDRRLEGSESGLAWIPFVNGEPLNELTVSLAAVHHLRDHGQWNGRSFATLAPRASALFVQRAIGRAIAHEIGHYLLRSRVHERRGLMRAVFTVDETMKVRPALGPAARSYAAMLAAKEERAANDTR